jgi:NAD(P)-dependent dehydrogenase (short-subunit alcohol dehydrogenase family)
MAPKPSFPVPVEEWHEKPYAAIDPTRPELSSKGKNVLITGGGSGIGGFISTAFAQSGASNLAIIGRTLKSLEAKKAEIEKNHPGTKVFTYAANLLDVAALEAAVSGFAKSVNGVIDVLVANAGYCSDIIEIEEADPEEWWQQFEVNVKGNFNLVRAFKKNASPTAAVIAVSTAIAVAPYHRGYSGYAASKIAFAKFMEYFRYENPGMQVINYHPGVVHDTEIDKKTVASGTVFPYVEGLYLFSSWRIPRELALVMTDMSVDGLPANAAVWLASPEANFLNGRFVWCQWDVNELKAHHKQIESGLLFTIGTRGWPDIPAWS